MENYKPLPPHTISKEEEEYLKTLNKKEYALHEMATKLLGSSYFVKKSHAYKNRNNVKT